MFGHRVIDRFQYIIGLKVALGYIGRVIAAVNEHVVPGLVFRWTGFGNGLIPFLRALKGLIDIDDNTAIIEQAVVN